MRLMVFQPLDHRAQVALEMAHRVVDPADPTAANGAGGDGHHHNSNTTITTTANGGGGLVGGSGGTLSSNSGGGGSAGALSSLSAVSIDSLENCLIFKPGDIVSIVAKDVDLEFATRDTLPTDMAITQRCNGGGSGGGGMSEEKELEPWDCTNGDDISLELDGNANGWDANDMFHKNESIYGVQSTFDQSLAGYTMQIEKKNTQDYK